MDKEGGLGNALLQFVIETKRKKRDLTTMRFESIDFVTARSLCYGVSTYWKQRYESFRLTGQPFC